LLKNVSRFVKIWKGIIKSDIPMRELFRVIFMEYFKFLRGNIILCDIEFLEEKAISFSKSRDSEENMKLKFS
jgi:hypothetical protein